MALTMLFTLATVTLAVPTALAQAPVSHIFATPESSLRIL